MAKPIAGAQLYTLRQHMKTIPDIVATLGKVRAIGYTAAQFSGVGPVDPAELGKVIRDSGVTACATHVGWPRFQKDLDAVIAEHQMWNCRHAAIGGLPEEYFTADGVKRFLDELAPISARLAAAGLDFSYHNHHHELAVHGGRTWLGALYAEADPNILKAELDTYWIQAGGGDPAAWVRRCAGREPLLHLKDMCITPTRQQRFAPIGQGNLNWEAILAAAEAGGVEYLLVEQDDCYDYGPFHALTVSYQFLAEKGYR